jgi:cytochrome c oxidase assembly factor CtaG/cytochrome c2
MRLVMMDWSFEPWIVASLAVAMVWYCIGLQRIRRRVGSGRIARIDAVAAFAAGIGVLVIALLSPIDRFGEQLFSVHMVQHLLLIMVAAPLLAWSRPTLVFIWAFPLRGRKGVGRAWTGAGLRGAIRGIMHPLPVWLLFTGSFVFWHFPRPYGWALANEWVHAAEHLSFFVTALMFWTIVFEPATTRRLSYGATLVFVSTNAILSGLPGALMILAPRPLYTVHAAGVAAWHLTLIQDQQLAGLIMWIPGGLVYVIAVCFVFVRWLAEPDRRTPSRHNRAAFVPVAVLLLTVPLVGSCNDHGSHAVASATGDPQHGAALIRQFGCGSCHVVPGIDNATGVVGPPLMQVGRRIYIAGVLRNTPNNMVRWIRGPQQFVPGNAMPDMGINQPDAQDVAAYLSTLR